MKNELLEKAFKIRFVLKLCLLTVIGGLAVTLSLYFITSKSLGTSYGQAIYAIHDLKIRIFPLIFASFYSIFILAIITAAIAAISVLFSHKIAGPIYRLEKNLEAIGSGDLTVDTKFRGKDQLTVLASEINGMVRSLNHLARSSGEAASGILESERKIEALLKKEASEAELQAALEELKLHIEKLKGISSQIMVKD